MSSGKEKHANSSELEAPLDYSFYGMTSLQDIVFWYPRRNFTPRSHPRSSEIPDNEPRNLSSPHGTTMKIARKSQDEEKPSRSRCLKLNNNCLSDISELKSVASGLFEDVENIAWIDLSFNELIKIDDIILEFPNLQILYLHGNQISDMKEVEKLAYLSNLKKLSLHGNPLENEKGYKYMVMAKLPNLQALDFSRITKADRRTASTLEVMNKNVRKGKKKSKAEES